MHRSAIARFLVALTLICAPLTAITQASTAGTFQNPLLPTGPDPWVTRADDGYYYMNTTGKDLVLRRTHDITQLATAETKTVWTPPLSGPYSKQIWAPEINQFDGHWFIYFAADDGNNSNHRIYVLENTARNPMEGTWTFHGKVSDATDRWAIDPTVFENRGQKYMVWSGWDGDANGEQRIYIAHLKNPWTIDSARTMVSYPKYPWEHVGDTPNDLALPHIEVNEGPEVLQHGNDVFVIYSGSGCWTDFYELGMVRAPSDSNFLDPTVWHKYDHPVFRQDRAAKVFAPGHNGFFQSPDGKQDWIIYHANSASNAGCGTTRSPRMQRFTWNSDGTPNFGQPLATGIIIEKPSGTPVTK